MANTADTISAMRSPTHPASGVIAASYKQIMLGIPQLRCNPVLDTPYSRMGIFNYSAPAEIFGSAGRQRGAVTYRRFASGAEAVRFAVEGMSQAFLPGITLQADDDRFDHHAIRALYDSAKYPLVRRRGGAEEGLQLVQSPATPAPGGG